MSDDKAFADLMARVRHGDGRAARELFRQFETQVRLDVRKRLRDPRLRRLVDEIRGVADLRRTGRKWTEIAQELADTAARRVQLQRAARRVGRELGLEDDDE